MSDKLSNLSDRELLAELKTFNAATALSPAEYNLTNAETDALKTDLNAFETALNDWDAVNADYDAKLEAKKAARLQAVDRGRQQRRQVRAKPGISNDRLASANLTPYDDTPTASPSPASAPFAVIEYAKLRHTINFRDKNTPHTDKKPDGMYGAEIWLKIGGDAPVDNKECEYLTTDRATPYLWQFDAEDAGKTAWYLLRWISKNGDKGEWSQAVSATING